MTPESIIETTVTQHLSYRDVHVKDLAGIGAQVVNELRRAGYVVVAKVI